MQRTVPHVDVDVFYLLSPTTPLPHPSSASALALALGSFAVRAQRYQPDLYSRLSLASKSQSPVCSGASGVQELLSATARPTRSVIASQLESSALSDPIRIDSSLCSLSFRKGMSPELFLSRRERLGKSFGGNFQPHEGKFYSAESKTRARRAPRIF
jgi:hypothetical protein